MIVSDLLKDADERSRSSGDVALALQEIADLLAAAARKAAEVRAMHAASLSAEERQLLADVGSPSSGLAKRAKGVLAKRGDGIDYVRAGHQRLAELNRRKDAILSGREDATRFERRDLLRDISQMETAIDFAERGR